MACLEKMDGGISGFQSGDLLSIYITTTAIGVMDHPDLGERRLIASFGAAPIKDATIVGAQAHPTDSKRQGWQPSELGFP